MGVSAVVGHWRSQAVRQAHQTRSTVTILVRCVERGYVVDPMTAQRPGGAPHRRKQQRKANTEKGDPATATATIIAFIAFLLDEQQLTSECIESKRQFRLRIRGTVTVGRRPRSSSLKEPRMLSRLPAASPEM